MGPRSHERGNSLTFTQYLEIATLQWGRVLTNAETPFGPGLGVPLHLCASMGPRSHERGNTPAADRMHGASHRFNGAAFSRTRKHARRMYHRTAF